MKNKLLLKIIFLLVFRSGWTQTNKYHPFPDSNAVWSQHYQHSTSSGNYLYSIFGDTTINSIKYNKVYRYAENLSISDTIITKSNSTLIGGIREDTIKRIFFYCTSAFWGSPAQQDSIYKLYDFSKHVGDTIFFSAAISNPYAYQYLVIDTIDSIKINHQYRKRYNFKYPGEPWIEGIGSTRDLLSTIMPYLMCTCINETVCYKYYDTVYYMNPTYNTCYPFTGASVKDFKFQEGILVFPNPSNTYFIIETNTADKQTADLYDVNGSHVFSASVSDKEIINVAALDEGIYTLTIKTADRVVNKKLVILR